MLPTAVEVAGAMEAGCVWTGGRRGRRERPPGGAAVPSERPQWGVCCFGTRLHVSLVYFILILVRQTHTCT